MRLCCDDWAGAIPKLRRFSIAERRRRGDEFSVCQYREPRWTCAPASPGQAHADASRGDAEPGRAKEEAKCLGEADVGRGDICGLADVGRRRRNGAAWMMEGAAGECNALWTAADPGVKDPAG